MPTKKPRLILTLDEDLLRRIDEFQESQGISTRSEAMRRLIEEGLRHYGRDALSDQLIKRTRESTVFEKATERLAKEVTRLILSQITGRDVRVLEGEDIIEVVDRETADMKAKHRDWIEKQRSSPEKPRDARTKKQESKDE